MADILISPHSDLHIERGDAKTPFLNISKPDIIVFAGDIDRLDDVDLFLFDVAEKHENAHIIYVPGNHDYFCCSDMDSMYQSSKKRAEIHPRIHYLQEESIVIHGIRFLGCTLWTNFKGMGPVEELAAKTNVKKFPDFLFIRQKYQLFTPNDCQLLGDKQIAWLTGELEKPFDGKTVVISHFSPSMKLAHRNYIGSSTNAYFNLDLDELIKKTKPALWFYGHTHDNFDEYIGDTHFISNQAGYIFDGNKEISDYNPELVIPL